MYLSQYGERCEEVESARLSFDATASHMYRVVGKAVQLARPLQGRRAELV